MDDATNNRNDQLQNDGSQHTVSKTTNTSEALTRRRLVKGAMAAAPAIFTLQSGAARAAVSNLQCLVDQPTFTPKTNFVHVPESLHNAESPEWVRSKVSGFIVENGKWRKIALIPESTGIYSGMEYHDKKGNTWVAKLVDGIQGFVKEAKKDDPRLLDPASDFYKKQFYLIQQSNVDRFKIVHVDMNGNYVASSSTGNPVTVSCWTSFA